MAASSTIIWHVVPDEHVRAVRTLRGYHAKQESRLARELRALSLALLVLAGAALVGWRWWVTRELPLVLSVALGVPTALGAAYLATRTLAVKRAARRQLRENPLATEERRYVFDEHGIRIGGQTFEDKFRWRDVTHIAETPEFFLIFIAARSAYYLPKRAVTWPETLDGLREIFREALGDRSKVR